MAASLTATELTKKRMNKSQDVQDNVNKEEDTFSFGIIDLAVLIFSVVSIVSDLFTDLILVFQYSNQGYTSLAVGTFLLIFFPSIVVQFFSLRWHIIDKTASILHWVLHFCMLGIVHRYVHVINIAFAAYKSKSSSDIQKVFLDQSDLCMLHLFESFLESAPQLVLQMYVIAVLHEWRFLTGLSALASLLSLAWALAAYTKAQRRARPNKNSTTWPGLLLQAIWRTGMLTSRITTLVLAAYCFGNYIFLIIGVHWVAMTIWIIHQKTDFCDTHWEEKIYNGVVGVIYCFCFFNLQEGQSRWRALAFYLVIIFQNLACLTIFLMLFGEKSPKVSLSGFVAVVGGTLLGAASMLVYYRFFHPSGPIKLLWRCENLLEQDESLPYSTMNLRSLKRGRCEVPSDACPKAKSDFNGEIPLSESIVIIEENVLDDTDVEIKILQDWINEDLEKKPEKCNQSEKDKEAEAYKRRAICSSVDLAKLLGSKTENELRDNLKSVGTDDTSSDVLSAHDYENLCAVNIAREPWGLRSWRGYSDIETWLHDDSVVHDRRLDTLTSTTDSERSANTQKDSELIRHNYYIDSVTEDLARFESDTNSDYILTEFSMESLPMVYPSAMLNPIYEEAEEFSTNSTDSAKIRNGLASVLVATIDEIRRNTPIHNCYRFDDTYECGSPPIDTKPKVQGTLKKVTFASKCLTYPEGPIDGSATIQSTIEDKKILHKKERIPCPKDEICDKENITTGNVAIKISRWNGRLGSCSLQKSGGNSRIIPLREPNIAEKKSLFLMKPSTNILAIQRKIAR